MAKPRKVQEPAGAYITQAAEKADLASPKIQYLKDTPARKLADKLFAERKDLLRKLAK